MPIGRCRLDLMRKAQTPSFLMPRNADNLTLREIGAIAQLVERFHGMEEVRSSILLSSTFSLLRRETRVSRLAARNIGLRSGRPGPSPAGSVAFCLRQNAQNALLRRETRVSRLAARPSTLRSPGTSPGQRISLLDERPHPSAASTRLGVRGNSSNQMPVASWTAAITAGAYVM